MRLVLSVVIVVRGITAALTSRPSAAALKRERGAAGLAGLAAGALLAKATVETRRLALTLGWAPAVSRA
jgi:2-succinyl-5-enolpyruvyl-6-hydroxy-3-cyclohexene-1-carboxylate synthase